MQILQFASRLLLRFLSVLDGIGQVLFRHQIGIEIVVDDRRILIGSRNIIQDKGTVPFLVKMSPFQPEASRFHEDVQSFIEHESLIFRNFSVFIDGMGDICIDVNLSRSSWIIRTSFFPIDCPPGKQCSVVDSHSPCPLPRLRKNTVSIHQQRLSNLWLRVKEERKHVHFCIPEIMPFIAFTGKSLGRYVCMPITSGCLMQMEQIESQSDLECLVALQLNVTHAPELIHE